MIILYVWFIIWIIFIWFKCVLVMCYDCTLHNLQIEENAVESFEDIVRADNIPITMDSPLDPLPLSAFIEEWRIRLWDHAFVTYFKRHDHFKKSEDFSSFKGSDLAVKRVIFRLMYYILWNTSIASKSFNWIHDYFVDIAVICSIIFF